MSRRLAVVCVTLVLGCASLVHAEPVVVQGVPRLTWNTGQFYPHLAALTAALHSLGNTMSYDELMVASGAAFRTAWWPGWYNYGSPEVAPEDVVVAGAKAAGAQAERRVCASQEQAWTAICQSLDQGRPVLTWSRWGAVVICGYDPQGRKMLVQDYENPTDQYRAVPFVVAGMPDPAYGPNEVVLLRYDRNTPVPALDWPTILRRAIRFADWKREETIFKVYVFGLGSYDAWVETLRRGLDANGPQTDADLTRFMAWALVDARSRAATVLQANATLHAAFPRAAQHYQAEVELLKTMPAVLAKGAFADANVREAAAKLVEQAKAEEVQAVQALREAAKDLAPKGEAKE